MSRRYRIIVVIVMSVTMLFLCLGTAIDFPLEKYETTTRAPVLATIAKSDVPDTFSRKQIVYRLLTIWLDKHRIGTFGWTYWLWDYKIEVFEFYPLNANNTKSTVTVGIEVKPFLPDDFTFWSNPNTIGIKYGDWYPAGNCVNFTVRDNYYEISGPFSFC